ncbi:MAG: dihydroxy-acid dehydratase [Verrucomicrobiales bacterium]
MLPIPKYLLQQGVRDMIRISDARMSGTSYGACVLHVAPESAVGGPLAFVQSGDWIELDVEGRRLHLDVSDAELERRRADWVPPATKFTRGYGRLYAEEITQAERRMRFPLSAPWSGCPEPIFTESRRLNGQGRASRVSHSKGDPE